MRTQIIIVAAVSILAAGCAQPVEEPNVAAAIPPDNRALSPSSRTYGYSDAQVEAMGEKIKTIQYPVPQGETARVLGIQSPAYSSLKIDEYVVNGVNSGAIYRRTAPLNGRYELTIIEEQQINADRSTTFRETAAEIRRIAPR